MICTRVYTVKEIWRIGVSGNGGGGESMIMERGKEVRENRCRNIASYNRYKMSGEEREEER